MAYIGSAELLFREPQNWECGIITEDTNAIAQPELAIEQIKSDSIRYLGGTRACVLHICVDSLLARSIAGKFNEGCLDELSSSLDDVEKAIAEVDMPWAYAFESGGPLTSKNRHDMIMQLQQLIATL